MRKLIVFALVFSFSLAIIGCKNPTEGLSMRIPAPKTDDTIASGKYKKFSDSQIRTALTKLENVTQLEVIDNYKFQIGDKFRLTVDKQPDWTTDCTVSPSGKIKFGYLKKLIKVSDLTLSQIASVFELELKKYFNEPMVKIDNIEYSPSINTVNVIGFLRHPGRIKVKIGDRIMDLISQSGGIERKSYGSSGSEANKPAVDWNRAYIARYNEAKKMHEIIPYVSLYELLVKSKMKYNIKVKQGDIIYIPEATYDTNKVYVLGAVRKPGVFNYSSSISLIEALSLAGGFTNLVAEDEWVYIIRNSTDTNKVHVYVAELRKLLTGVKKAGKFVTNPLLQESDIVYVDTSGITEFGYWLRNFQPFWGATIGGASDVAYDVSYIIK